MAVELPYRVDLEIPIGATYVHLIEYFEEASVEYTNLAVARANIEDYLDQADAEIITASEAYAAIISYLQADTEDRDAIDLTGYTVRCQFRRHARADTALYEGTTENGHFVISNNDISWEIPDDVTAEWGFRKAVYDLEIESPEGKTSRLMYGTVKTLLNVTR